MAKTSVKGGVPASGASARTKRPAGTALRKDKPRVAPSAATSVRPMVANEPVTHRLALWGLLGLLFFPAFASGMFFPWTQDKGLVVAAVIFWLTWVWKYFDRDNRFLAGPLDWFALALPLAAVAAGIGAADYYLALNEVVKYLIYFLVFWSVARLITGEHVVHQILHAVYLSAVGVALAGLGCATGLLNVQDSFVGGRIYSTFQYPNATASYLAAALILGLYLWRRAREFRMPREIPALARFDGAFPYQYLYAAGNFFLLVTLLGTQSIGDLGVFTAALILYLVILPGGNRTVFVYHILTVLVAGAPAILLFLREVAANRMGPAWLTILAGLVLTVLLQWAGVVLERRSMLGVSPAQKRILAVVAAAVVLVVLAAGAFFLVRHPAYLQKLYVKLRGRDMIERGYFYLNALAMFVRRPVLGWGGGGWQAAYRVFQSYLYNSNQVHSYYLQLMVEMGAVGIVAVIGLWYSFLRLTHRLFHGSADPQRKLLVWTVTMVAVELGAHALIDFDLALSALFLVVWVMFGVAWALHRMGKESRVVRERKRVYVPLNHTVLAGSTACTVVIVLLGLTLAVSHAAAQDAVAQYNQLQSAGQAQSQYQEYQLVSDLKKAAAYNPLNPEMDGLPGGSVDTALALLDLDQQGQAAAGVALAQKAVALDGYNASNYDTLARLYNADNQPDKAVQAEEKAVALAPFQQQWYDALANVEVMAGVGELSGARKDPAQARAFFQDSLRLPARMTAQNDTRNALEKQLQVVGPALQPTPMINLSMGVADYFLGHYDRAAQEMKAAQSDNSLKDQALLWQSVLDQKTGKAAESAALRAQVQKDQPDLAAQYGYLAGLSLNGDAAPVATVEPAKPAAAKPGR